MQMRLFMLALLARAAAPQRLVVSVQTYARDHPLLSAGRASWRNKVPTVVVTNGSVERRIDSPVAYETWYEAPDNPAIGWNNPSENRYTSQIRFANASRDYDWILSGDDDTIFLMDNVRAFVSTLDPAVPYYFTDSLYLCSGGTEGAFACTLPGNAEVRGPKNCVVSPPAAPCFRRVMDAPGVCRVDGNRPGGHGGGPDEVEAAGGLVFGCGQDGFISSAGLVRSVSERDFAACEHCNTTRFRCYGGGDVRIGECYWSFGAHGQGIAPTKPYATERVFGVDRGQLMRAARAVVDHQPCDERCRFLLEKSLSTSVHDTLSEDLREISELHALYSDAKAQLAGTLYADANRIEAALARTVVDDAPLVAAKPLCVNGEWTEVDPAAIRRGDALPGVACWRTPGVCIEQQFLTPHRCSSRPRDADWPPLPAADGFPTLPQSVVRRLMDAFRGKRVVFLGDSITYNLFSFTVCEIYRAGFVVHKAGGDSRDAALRRADDATSSFWNGWYDAPWGSAGPPGDTDAEYVVDTDTLLVRMMHTHFKESTYQALETIADILVVNYGLHYDLVTPTQRARYASDLAALSQRLDAFAARPGKSAVYRETSRTHARVAGDVCGCTPVEKEPARNGLEWSVELNGIANKALHVPVVPFYEPTARMAYGHPENFSAYWNHFEHTGSCDCTHWCYSPQITRGFLQGVLDGVRQ